MEDPCTVSIQMERVLREKARVRAVMGCRSLAGYIRQLVRADIRIYEAENGPISIPNTEKERTP